MAENERGLVGEAEIARERQRGLSLDLVAEDRDGREIGAQRQLVRGEQRPRGNREIGLASAATEARRAVRAPAVVGVQAAALRANRRAVRLRPTHLGEHRLGLGVRHAEHLSEAEGLGRAGEKEMLRHSVTI